MSTDPDDIRADIERTRGELSSDVDALTDKVSPSQVVHRQADKVRSAAGDVRDRVMGAVSGTAEAAGSAASSLGDTAASVGDKATDLPGRARERTEGSPLAAGLVAFGVGLLVSSLLPSSRRERDLAQQAKDQAAPLVDEVKTAAQDVAEHLKEPAKDAATAVKDSAVGTATDLRDEGRAAAQDVKDEAVGSSGDDESTHGAHAAGGGPGTPGL
ncbi:DUF3618 domain-containing protein [Cellulomonas sp. DKR-3]|uniref:DUF3618 domain-containing protein n=1 Tax=Cellulomonas fulva TaxID=2835530 RepID=A0ABS5TZX4_9CELL|nr:DUF3618 domain-containing protein [Cellulomonas fulva]MBT0994702.1 DUF3618 domain-containing protein [Cellulomonas fulva]